MFIDIAIALQHKIKYNENGGRMKNGGYLFLFILEERTKER